MYNTLALPPLPLSCANKGSSSYDDYQYTVQAGSRVYTCCHRLYALLRSGGNKEVNALIAKDRPLHCQEPCIWFDALRGQENKYVEIAIETT